MMYTVVDGTRNLRFEGKELAHSSSHVQGKPRWIEFTLYRTEKGHYVLSRVGSSRVFHYATCPTVRRNSLDALPAETLSADAVPCEKCLPDSEPGDLVFPEMDRRWAQVSDSAEGVVSSLKQRDDRGVDYLTTVARYLLEDAATTDPGIREAFYTEWIE